MVERANKRHIAGTAGLGGGKRRRAERRGARAPGSSTSTSSGAQDRRTRPRACIFGVYGKGNLGDEALLAAIRHELDSVSADVELTVFCSSPENVAGYHGLQAVSRRPLRRFSRKLSRILTADLFLIGSGTLLRDALNWRDELRVVAGAVFWPLVAKIAGVPVVALAAGIGPAKHRVMRAAIKGFYSVVDRVTFRDAGSAVLFASLGGRRACSVICDPVVSSPLFEPARIRRAASAETLAWRAASPAYVVLAIRRPEWQPVDASMAYLEACASAVARLHRETAARIVLVPVHLSAEFPDDRQTARVLDELLRKEGVDPDHLSFRPWNTLEDGAAVLQGAELIVSDRLHALLLGANAGVAGVGTSGTDKIRGCLEMIGFSPALTFVDPTEQGPRRLEEALVAAWHGREAHRGALLEGVRRWRDRGSGLELLRGYLTGSRSGAAAGRRRLVELADR
jgi:polysaccharide pyruvyl transferase WcaK-like protein